MTVSGDRINLINVVPIRENVAEERGDKRVLQ